MKKIMVSVILVVLTLIAFCMLTEQNVKADASEVTVVSYSQYVASSTSTLATAPGDLIVVGELENIGTNIIANMSVQGTAISANGQTLAVTTSQAFAYYMKQGQKAPFYLDFTAQSSETQDLTWIASVKQIVFSYEQIVHADKQQYADVQVVHDMNYTDNSGLYVIRAVVENQGNLIIQKPWVVTTFYNATGAVVGLNFTNFLTETLSPNGGVLFYATPTDNNTQTTSQIVSYAFQVDSLTLTSASSTPTSSTNPTSTPIPTSTTTPTPTTALPTASPTPSPSFSLKPSGSSGFYFSVVGIVAIVAVVGIVVIAIVAFTVLVLLKKHNREAKPI